MKKDFKYYLSVEENSSSNVFSFVRRLFATACCYFLFGLGCVIMCGLVIPTIILFTKDKQRRSRIVRSVIRHTFSLYLSILEFMNILNIKADTLMHLHNLKGKLIICNHPTLLDVVIIMSRLRNIQCVVNNTLWSNPFVGMIVHAAGYIRNNLDIQTFLQECQHAISGGENILIFPEGTRTRPGQGIKMSRGVANLALCAEADIHALTMKCSFRCLEKGAKWYHIPPRRIDFVLTSGPTFSYKNYLELGPRSIQARGLMRDIIHYYEESIIR